MVDNSHQISPAFGKRPSPTADLDGSVANTGNSAEPVVVDAAAAGVVGQEPLLLGVSSHKTEAGVQRATMASQAATEGRATDTKAEDGPGRTRPVDGPGMTRIVEPAAAVECGDGLRHVPVVTAVRRRARARGRQRDKPAARFVDSDDDLVLVPDYAIPFETWDVPPVDRAFRPCGHVVVPVSMDSRCMGSDVTLRMRTMAIAPWVVRMSSIAECYLGQEVDRRGFVDNWTILIVLKSTQRIALRYGRHQEFAMASFRYFVRSFNRWMDAQKRIGLECGGASKGDGPNNWTQTAIVAVSGSKSPGIAYMDHLFIKPTTALDVPETFGMDRDSQVVFHISGTFSMTSAVDCDMFVTVWASLTPDPAWKLFFGAGSEFVAPVASCAGCKLAGRNLSVDMAFSNMPNLRYLNVPWTDIAYLVLQAKISTTTAADWTLNFVVNSETRWVGDAVRTPVEFDHLSTIPVSLVGTSPVSVVGTVPVSLTGTTPVSVVGTVPVSISSVVPVVLDPTVTIPVALWQDVSTVQGPMWGPPTAQGPTQYVAASMDQKTIGLRGGGGASKGDGVDVDCMFSCDPLMPATSNTASCGLDVVGMLKEGVRSEVRRLAGRAGENVLKSFDESLGEGWEATCMDKIVASVDACLAVLHEKRPDVFEDTEQTDTQVNDEAVEPQIDVVAAELHAWFTVYLDKWGHCKKAATMADRAVHLLCGLREPMAVSESIEVREKGGKAQGGGAGGVAPMKNPKKGSIIPARMEDDRAPFNPDEKIKCYLCNLVGHRAENCTHVGPITPGDLSWDDDLVKAYTVSSFVAKVSAQANMIQRLRAGGKPVPPCMLTQRYDKWYHQSVGLEQLLKKFLELPTCRLFAVIYLVGQGKCYEAAQIATRQRIGGLDQVVIGLLGAGAKIGDGVEFKYHGNYGGPGTDNMAAQPIDQADSQFMMHDLSYTQARSHEEMDAADASLAANSSDKLVKLAMAANMAARDALGSAPADPVTVKLGEISAELTRDELASLTSPGQPLRIRSNAGQISPYDSDVKEFILYPRGVGGSSTPPASSATPPRTPLGPAIAVVPEAFIACDNMGEFTVADLLKRSKRCMLGNVVSAMDRWRQNFNIDHTGIMSSRTAELAFDYPNVMSHISDHAGQIPTAMYPTAKISGPAVDWTPAMSSLATYITSTGFNDFSANNAAARANNSLFATSIALREFAYIAECMKQRLNTSSMILAVNALQLDEYNYGPALPKILPGGGDQNRIFLQSAVNGPLLANTVTYIDAAPLPATVIAWAEYIQQMKLEVPVPAASHEYHPDTWGKTTCVIPITREMTSVEIGDWTLIHLSISRLVYHQAVPMVDLHNDAALVGEHPCRIARVQIMEQYVRVLYVVTNIGNEMGAIVRNVSVFDTADVPISPWGVAPGADIMLHVRAAVPLPFRSYLWLYNRLLGSSDDILSAIRMLGCCFGVPEVSGWTSNAPAAGLPLAVFFPPPQQVRALSYPWSDANIVPVGAPHARVANASVPRFEVPTSDYRMEVSIVSGFIAYTSRVDISAPISLLTNPTLTWGAITMRNVFMKIWVDLMAMSKGLSWQEAWGSFTLARQAQIPNIVSDWQQTLNHFYSLSIWNKTGLVSQIFRNTVLNAPDIGASVNCPDYTDLVWYGVKIDRADFSTDAKQIRYAVLAGNYVPFYEIPVSHTAAWLKDWMARMMWLYTNCPTIAGNALPVVASQKVSDWSVPHYARIFAPQRGRVAKARDLVSVSPPMPLPTATPAIGQSVLVRQSSVLTSKVDFPWFPTTLELVPAGLREVQTATRVAEDMIPDFASN